MVERGSRMSEEQKEKIRQTNIKTYSDPHIRKKISLKTTGKKRSEETKEKIRAIMKKKWSDQEYRQCMTSKHVGKILSQKHKDAIGDSLRGEKSYMWLSGKSFEGYGIEFNGKLKKSIRQRDNHRCQMCGVKPDDLYVHHIDYDKTNNNKDNLISLCGSCHTKTNHHRRGWIDILGAFMSYKNTDIDGVWELVKLPLKREER